MEDKKDMQTNHIPKVSIGMPVYNCERFIRKALDSLLAQTITDFELIISDNASTDETEEICSEYAEKDSRIRFIRQPENKGAANNFSFVLELARGKYFMWAACDDYWHPEFVVTMVGELEKHRDAGVAFCAINRVWENGEFLDNISFKGKANPNRMSYFRLALAIASQSRHYMFIYGLFRADYLKCIFDGIPVVAEGDQIFMCGVALTTHFRYVDQVLHVRMVQCIPLMKRYSSERLGQIVQNPFYYFTASPAALVFLFRSKHISWQRKVYIPLIALLWGISLIKPGFHHLVVVLGIRLIGKRNARRIKSWIRRQTGNADDLSI